MPIGVSSFICDGHRDRMLPLSRSSLASSVAFAVDEDPYLLHDLKFTIADDSLMLPKR